MSSDSNPLTKAVGGLALRSIGPAFMGGRIADITVDPRRRSTWYVAVGSGGVWKTTNAGTTWTPIFDDQPSYSIGCLTLDPSAPDTVWVGTGEAVSGRHVAWGSGVYRSHNGGASWEGLGLDDTDHIADIVVDPRDGDVVLVAAEGPLWSPGGQRGVYRTTDGGQSWDRVLEIDDDTGVTSLVAAPDNPDIIYAAAYQRRRHVATFVGGGPGSGIYKSTDGGVSWRQVTEGLPKGDMGKIGLAVTAADPDRVYATVEASEDERGMHVSFDRGESWERRAPYISGGTGPHYYQEIFASPTDPDLVYQVDVFVHVTRDGGRTFTRLESGKNKHSDNHTVWIDPNDDQHLLVGTDAGVYETFDQGVTFRHVPNLPISQLYRVAVDNSVPFTTVLAGAQDLGTLMGPTRTTNEDGVRNQDWTVPLGADGYHTAFDPTDPDICYLEWQGGNMMRHDRRTGELVDIQPTGAEGDPPERWNWDCPILISPHNPSRIYAASQRLWRSDDRGERWTAVSGDLTMDRNRHEMASFGAVQSVDALHDLMAMSLFSTISTISESPVEEGLLYVGTDDGMVHVSADGGGSWDALSLPGEGPDKVPEEAYINAVKASEHDADTVFVAADDHKHGDYTPYLLASTDRGRTWRSIRGDLPDEAIVWAIEQDHVVADLIFLASEGGLFFTLDGGEAWHRLTKDVPTISFRDLALQRRDDDLVGASFGRGIYVLDDYGPLRSLADADLAEGAAVFPVRDAWLYQPRPTAQASGQPALGSTAFRTPNPDFGATITYHLSEALVEEVSGPRKRRQAAEKAKRERAKEADEPVGDVAFPGLDGLWHEHVTPDPSLVLVVRTAAADPSVDDPSVDDPCVDDPSVGDGTPVRVLAATAEAGLHRTSWDLRLTSPEPVSIGDDEWREPWAIVESGPLVGPGSYTVELAVLDGNGVRPLTPAQGFEVRPIPALADAFGAEADNTWPGVEFGQRARDLNQQALGAVSSAKALARRIPSVRATIVRTATDDQGLLPRLESIHQRTEELLVELNGNPVSERLSDAASPSTYELIRRVAFFKSHTTGPPTQTQVDALDRGAARLAAGLETLATIEADLGDLVADLEAAGGTWTKR